MHRVWTITIWPSPSKVLTSYAVISSSGSDQSRVPTLHSAKACQVWMESRELKTQSGHRPGDPFTITEQNFLFHTPLSLSQHGITRWYLLPPSVHLVFHFCYYRPKPHPNNQPAEATRWRCSIIGETLTSSGHLWEQRCIGQSLFCYSRWRKSFKQCSVLWLI